MIHNLFGPVAGLFLGLAAAPAFAGEWVPVDTGQAGLFAITYQSEKMLPGEQATLVYTDTEIASLSGLFNGVNISVQTKVNTVSLRFVLTSGDEPITGFKGITLRSEDQGEELVTFYRTESHGKPEEFGPTCGGYTLQDLRDGRDAQCVSWCYRSYDDVAAQKNVIACNGGEAHWIAIYTAGTLREQLEIGEADKRYLEGMAKVFGGAPRMSYDEIVAAANYLFVHVTWPSSSSISFPINDRFRTALWDETVGRQ